MPASRRKGRDSGAGACIRDTAPLDLSGFDELTPDNHDRHERIGHDARGCCIIRAVSAGRDHLADTAGICVRAAAATDRILMATFSPFAEVKTRTNEPQVHPVYCPISGRFSFSYDIDDGTESVTECVNSDSQISNCPLGFGLHLNFNGCAFRPNFSECRSVYRVNWC